MFVTKLLHSLHDALGQYSDPRTLHLTAHVCTHILVEPPKDVFTAVDDRYFETKAGENTGEL